MGLSKTKEGRKSFSFLPLWCSSVSLLQPASPKALSIPIVQGEKSHVIGAASYLFPTTFLLQKCFQNVSRFLVSSGLFLFFSALLSLSFWLSRLPSLSQFQQQKVWQSISSPLKTSNNNNKAAASTTTKTACEIPSRAKEVEKKDRKKEDKGRERTKKRKKVFFS